MKIKTFSVAVVLFSGLTLGSTVISPVVSAATTETSAELQVSNTIVYSLVGSQTVVQTTTVSGPLGYQVPLVAPAGYKLADPANNSIKLINGANPRQYVKVVADPQAAAVHTKINYIDQATNRTISSQQLDGLEGQAMDLEIPNLYEVVNANDSQYTLVKGVYSKDILVKQMPLAAGEIINTVRYRVNHSNKYILTKQVSGKIGSYQKVEVPAGYKLAFNESTVYPISATDKIHIVVVEPDKNYVGTQVNFIEAGTNKTVGSKLVEGSVGQSISLDFPNGYQAVNAADNKLTMVPGVKTKNILVKAGAENPDTESVNGTIAIINNPSAHLYNKDGKKLTRSLGYNTDWKIDQKQTVNGTTYYRVSTNEWVKESDAQLYTSSPRNITTTNGGNKALYNINGTKSDRSITSNSVWYSDRFATINGQRMYRVSTNEWVAASDIR